MRVLGPRPTAPVVLPLLALGACGGDIARPLSPDPAPPRAAIRDAAHGVGGNQHFFFLPPMVPTTGHNGAFDGGQSPVVTVWTVSPGAS